MADASHRLADLGEPHRALGLQRFKNQHRPFGCHLPNDVVNGRSTLITVSSGLAFVPLVAAPTYSATKAAVHSYSVSLRQQLQGTSVAVIEIAPPYVQTALLGEFQAIDPHAMPLADFISETISLLATGATEVIVERCKPLRFAAENGKMDDVLKALIP